MSALADDHAASEQFRKVLNLQADMLLQMTQNRTEIWQVAISAMAAGAALFAAGAGLAVVFLRH
jgi:hypothetical protein